MSKLRDVLFDFLGTTGGPFLDWVGDALHKIGSLQWSELTADQAIFVIAVMAIVAAGLVRLLRPAARTS